MEAFTEPLPRDGFVAEVLARGGLDRRGAREPFGSPRAAAFDHPFEDAVGFPLELVDEVLVAVLAVDPSSSLAGSGYRRRATARLTSAVTPATCLVWMPKRMRRRMCS